MQSLLDQIKKLNEILKQSAVEYVAFDTLTKQISEILSANCYVSDPSGRILAYKTSSVYECATNNLELQDELFPADFNDELNGYENTIANLYTEHPSCIYGEKGECIFSDRYLTVIPIMFTGKRLGTFVLAKYGTVFGVDELIVCEYACAIIAMEMIKIEEVEYKAKITQKTAVKMAVSTLSYSENAALKLIFAKLDGDEGLIVASDIAEEAHITRSVISNALRKLESAGVLKTRSLGMKGTYIKIVNPYVNEELGI